MLKSNPILKFAIIFIGAYFLLTGVTQLPGVNGTINAIFRGISKTALGTSLPQLKINTKAARENGILDDNKMIVEFEWTEEKVQAAIAEARRLRQADLQVPYRFISYLIFEFFLVPLLFLFSLILATPMPIKTKMKTGSIAILVLLAFLLIKLYLMTIFSVSNAQIDVYELSHSTMSRLQWLAGVMTMGLSIMLSFFIWLIFVFRKSELKDLINTWFSSLSPD